MFNAKCIQAFHRSKHVDFNISFLLEFSISIIFPQNWDPLEYAPEMTPFRFPSLITLALLTIPKKSRLKIDPRRQVSFKKRDSGHQQLNWNSNSRKNTNFPDFFEIQFYISDRQFEFSLSNLNEISYFSKL